MNKKLTLQQLKEVIKSQDSIYGDVEHAILMPYGDYVTVAARAKNPREGGLMEYRHYFNMYGEKVAGLTSRYGNWYDPCKKRKTGVILRKDPEEYSKIKAWLQCTDPSIQRFKLGTEAL